MEIATPPRDHIPRGGVVSFSGAPPVRRDLAGLCHKRRASVQRHFSTGKDRNSFPKITVFVSCVRDRDRMKIVEHSESHIVKLDDGSTWQIFAGDIDQTLAWLPTTELRLFEMNDEVASHALINCDDGTHVRARPQGEEWPMGKLKDVLKKG